MGKRIESGEGIARAWKKGQTELPSIVRDTIKGTKSPVDSSNLLAELIEIWGGPRHLARSIYEEFMAAQQGGMTRQRILEMLQRLVINVTTDDTKRPLNPAQYSTEELEMVAMEYMKKMMEADTKKRAKQEEDLSDPEEVQDEDGMEE